MNDNIDQPDNGYLNGTAPTPPGANSRTIKLLVRIILMIFPAFFGMALGAFFFIDLHQRSQCTEKVSGVVVKYTEHTSYTNDYPSTGFASVFEYTYNGVKYTNSNKVYHSSPFFEIGHRTDILVNPDDPLSIYVPEDNAIRKMLTFFFAIWLGVIIIVVIIIPEIIFRKKKL